jgi:hypothetical protein
MKDKMPYTGNKDDLTKNVPDPECDIRDLENHPGPRDFNTRSGSASLLVSEL